MAEIENLLSVFGAVDQALVDDPSHAPLVAPLLTPYEGGGAIGWYESFRQWAQETQPASAPLPLPDPESALAGMAEEEPRGQLRGRRLLALTALARVDSDFAPGGARAEVAASALGPIMRRDTQRSSHQLLERVAGPDPSTRVLGGLDEWSTAVALLEAEGLVDEETARHTAAPCQGRLIMQEVDGRWVPVVVLQTSFTAPGLTLDDVRPYLDPDNWPQCSTLWCAMQRLNPDALPRQYLEEISVACDRDDAWRLRTCLDVVTGELPATLGVTVEYWLSDNQSGGDGLVEVDEGGIVARSTSGGVDIVTTKRLRFAGPFDGPALAMIACALGYGSAAQDMVFACAQEQHPLENGWSTDRRDQFGALNAPTPSPADAAWVDAMIAGLAESTTQCVDEWAASTTTSLDKALSGTYTANDAVNDMVAGWARSVRHLGRMTSAFQAAAAASQAGSPSPPQNDSG
jgi:hypothetical protein